MKKLGLLVILALINPRLEASQHQKPLLTIVATSHNPRAQQWKITCTPEAVGLLDKIQFRQNHDRWTSSLVATHGADQQTVIDGTEIPPLNTQNFHVDRDETTEQVTFSFLPAISPSKNLTLTTESPK